MVKGLNRDKYCVNGLEKVYHYETHQYMPIDMDSESANVVLANEQHMDILKMISKSYKKITFKMYQNCAKVTSIAKS